MKLQKLCSLCAIVAFCICAFVSCTGTKESQWDKNGFASKKTMNKTVSETENLESNQTRMVIAPPTQGVYLGQTTFREGEVEELEKIVGNKIAIVADYSLVRGTETAGMALQFDLVRANAYADAGYAIIVGAYEAYPGHKGFTVDQLLKGKYDLQLTELAEQFRQYRGYMFFTTCREPNGVLQDFYGGFGQDGDKSLLWAIRNHAGFDKFHPPQTSQHEAQLYSGLGRDDLADGIERLGAAQRYYHDFFIRRQRLTNLTFETMGWATQGPMVVRKNIGAYERRLNEALSLESLLTSIGNYYDWISINWYLNTEPEAETGYHPSEAPQRHSEAMELRLQQIAKIAPNRPVLLTEFGILEPNRKQKAKEAFKLIKSSGQIKGVVFWGAKVSGNPFDGALRFGEPSAVVLQGLTRGNSSWAQPVINAEN